MQVLRNVFRRKLRVFLTIFGITIGVLALVVMGSMAEKINLLVSGGIALLLRQGHGDGRGLSCHVLQQAALLQQARRDQGRPRRGRGLGQIGTLLDNEASMSFGMPAMISGSDMRGDDLESFKIALLAGPGDSAPGRYRRRWWWAPTWSRSSAPRWASTSPCGASSSRSWASWTRLSPLRTPPSA